MAPVVQLSPPPPSSFASIDTGKPGFTWKMAVKMEREPERNQLKRSDRAGTASVFEINVVWPSKLQGLQHIYYGLPTMLNHEHVCHRTNSYVRLLSRRQSTHLPGQTFPGTLSGFQHCLSGTHYHSSDQQVSLGRTNPWNVMLFPLSALKSSWVLVYWWWWCDWSCTCYSSRCHTHRLHHACSNKIQNSGLLVLNYPQLSSFSTLIFHDFSMTKKWKSMTHRHNMYFQVHDIRLMNAYQN